MSDLTPETLQGFDFSIPDDPALAEALRLWMFRHASAWEADRKERDELRRRVIERLERNRELNAQIEALAKEIKVDDELLAERDRLLDAIPACEAHGNRCVPHAIEWVRAALAAKEER